MSAANWLFALLAAVGIGVGIALLVNTIAKRREAAELLQEQQETQDLERQIIESQEELHKIFAKLSADVLVLNANQLNEIADLYITDPNQSLH